MMLDVIVVDEGNRVDFDVIFVEFANDLDGLFAVGEFAVGENVNEIGLFLDRHFHACERAAVGLGDNRSDEIIEGELVGRYRVTASTWTAGGAGQSVVSEGPDIRHLLRELEETWEELVVICGWDWSCLVVIVNCIRLLLHLHED